MEEINNQPSGILLERRYSEDVNELMERKPSFVIRHGISIVFFLLVLFLAMTNFIPYTDSINVNAIIMPNCHEIWCQAQEDGEIIYIFDELEKKVRKNDTLVIVEYFNNNSNYHEQKTFISPYNGIAYKPGDLRPFDLIYKGDLVLLVCDCCSNQNKVIAKSFVGQDLIYKIEVGMKMTLIDKPVGAFRVNSISRIPDRNGLYIVYYEYVGGKVDINRWLLQEKILDARISIGATSIYKKFFEDGIFNFTNIIKREEK